jgi:uncharacterized repeat protein (TIGR03803 family)
MSRTLEGRICHKHPRAIGGMMALSGALVSAFLAIPLAQATTYEVRYSFACGADGSNPYGGLVRDTSGNLYGTTLDGGIASGSAGYGVVYKLSPTGVLAVLHPFAGPPNDGSSPLKTLVRDAAGNIYGTTDEGGTYNVGTAFKITPALVESVLHSFDNKSADGTYPAPGLMQGAAGYLYGTTIEGGKYHYGTVYSLTPQGAETVLYGFGAYSGDGEHPHATVFQDAAGNLYGTTKDGGAHSHGTVYELTLAGVETVLYSFGAYSGDGELPHSVLIQDGSGNFYGTTREGGATGDGTVFELTATGEEKILWNFEGPPSDGQDPRAGLVMDKAGNLYGTTFAGGASKYGTVFELTPTGQETILHSFADTASDGGNPQSGLLLDAAGNLYGDTYYGGASSCGTVFKVKP